MKPIEIHKFGGTSVADAKRMLAVCQLIATCRDRAQPVVVCSATAGTTNLLVQLTTDAADGQVEKVRATCDEIEQQHLSILDQLSPTSPAAEATTKKIKSLVGEICQTGEAAAKHRTLTPRDRDRMLATGEKLAVRLMAEAFGVSGISAVPCDADLFLETDGNFGMASPRGGASDCAIQTALSEVIGTGAIPVVTGFCGRAPDGATTTLGRGGSDLTATLLAAGLDAAEVTIWTDVDGVFSADPTVVPDARVIRQVNYREAGEMSFYGAKVLHQRTMIPVADKGIPVRIQNSFRPSAKGTVVDGRFTPGSHPVKAVSAIRGQALLSIEGKGMVGVPGFAAKVFKALAKRDISITMISQSSSEASICLALPAQDLDAAKCLLKEALQTDISQKNVEEIATRRQVGLIAVVGVGMAKTPGVAGRTAGALGKERVNIVAIAQGSSELNITAAVDESHVDQAVRALHREFGLHRLDTGVDKPDGLDIILLGVGKIGRELINLVQHRQSHIYERFGLKARFVALADRSGYVLNPSGFDAQALGEILDKKSTDNTPLVHLASGISGSAKEMVTAALNYRLANPILVDASDANDVHDVFLAAFGLGCDVVTANKKPLAGPVSIFDELRNQAQKTGRILKAEATVGAGLPVVDTLEILVGTGDRLTAAEGSLSGTLGYVMSCLEQGMLFSKAVQTAYEKGFTEPDPVVDLTGADVARKAVILGRLSGLVSGDERVALKGLVDQALLGLPIDELMDRLKELDDPMATQVAMAKRQGQVMRYLAKVSPGAVSVGLMPVPVDSPAGRLAGTENLIVFNSERYDAIPLVITGPGAGVDVTASGVLGDIMRIAAERSAGFLKI
ncbi:MAG: bifunctional aspartate kinase/homoserine dehydrogenase I [Myxococcota bacterium]|nr:bifunctional aspartate kinase/homoserine dehydrogenase I [Myxococcota bacterium]